MKRCFEDSVKVFDVSAATEHRSGHLAVCQNRLHMFHVQGCYFSSSSVTGIFLFDSFILAAKLSRKRRRCCSTS